MKKYFGLLVILSLLALGCSDGGGGGGGGGGVFTEVQPYTLSLVDDFSGSGDVPANDTEGETVMDAIQAISQSLEDNGSVDLNIQSRAVYPISEVIDLDAEDLGTGTITITGTQNVSDPGVDPTISNIDITYTYSQCVLDDNTDYTINGYDHIRSNSVSSVTMSGSSIIVNGSNVTSQSSVYSVSGDTFACKVLFTCYYDYTYSYDLAAVLAGGTPTINFGTVRGEYSFYDNSGNLIHSTDFDENDIDTGDME